MPSESQFFAASYDTTTKIITAGICAFLAVLAIVTQFAAIGVIAAALIALTYAYSPRGYLISDQSIAVKRLIGEPHISLIGIREARRATADDFRGSIRLFGDGGVFGYYGLFRTTKLGKCWWYLTRRTNTVIVIKDQKHALFSPDDVDGFLAAIRAAAPVPGAETVGATIHRDSAGAWMGRVAGPLVLLAVAGIGAVALFYSPGPPSYTLTPTSLAIHDRFYPVTLSAADVDLDHIRVIDIKKDSEWRPTERTNGFANAHYRSGWFRVANGQKVRLYSAGSSYLVLLPPKREGNTVLVEVADPDQFVSDLRHKWSNG